MEEAAVSEPGPPAPGWNEYKLLVLDQLEKACKKIDDLERKMDTFRADDIANVKVEIALLKQKAGLWGAVAGLIPSVIAALLWWMSHK
jgi:hypothetical protein